MITSGCEPLSDLQFEAARRRADIVIAADETAAATAMTNGIALLAADTLFMRELSPNGEGCLWFASGEELASKLVFLAANPDFRNSLAAEGRRYILGARSPERIGRLYREAYTFALEQRKSISGPSDFRPALAPSRAA
jgi:glycosyltransferase involved in cell wall biosynthesis